MNKIIFHKILEYKEIIWGKNIVILVMRREENYLMIDIKVILTDELA